MGVKAKRGGKYANGTSKADQKKKYKHDKDYDLSMKEITKNGKQYYVLVRTDTGQLLKSAPEWRNDQSPRKWAEKHGFNFVS